MRTVSLYDEGFTRATIFYFMRTVNGWIHGYMCGLLCGTFEDCLRLYIDHQVKLMGSGVVITFI